MSMKTLQTAPPELVAFAWCCTQFTDNKRTICPATAEGITAPFQDGNGRLSRILTTLLLLQAGYAYVPYSSLESVIENSKESYYLALRQTQGTLHSEKPNWQPWLFLFTILRGGF